MILVEAEALHADGRWERFVAVLRYSRFRRSISHTEIERTLFAHARHYPQAFPGGAARAIRVLTVTENQGDILILPAHAALEGAPF